MKNLKIKDWIWVFYPIVVVIGLFVGLSMLFGDGGQRISSLGTAQNELDAQQAQLARLEQKEAILRSVDLERETATLVRLTEAMPATKKVWLLVSELAASGTTAGVPLTGLSGAVGDVKEATISGVAVVATPAAGLVDNMVIEAAYTVSSWEQVKTIVEKLSNSMPLVRIGNLTYENGEVVLIVEGAFRNWSRVAAESNNILPDITTSVTQVESRLVGFESIAGINSAEDEFLPTSNPF